MITVFIEKVISLNAYKLKFAMGYIDPIVFGKHFYPNAENKYKWSMRRRWPTVILMSCLRTNISAIHSSEGYGFNIRQILVLTWL